MRLIIFIALIISPILGYSTTDRELAYLEMLNYRLNMIAINNEMADQLAVIASELKRIRCKLSPTDADCEEQGK
jgi:hypothetical protein